MSEQKKTFSIRKILRKMSTERCLEHKDFDNT